jgi:hypothetical protein
MLLLSLAAMAVPLGMAAVTAYACTSVATLSDSPGAGLPGSTVNVSGAFFGTHDPSDATTAGPVLLRLGSITGPVLATATPTGTSRTFTVAVTIPADATPGDTFITATQADANGTPVYGTPARQAFSVTAPPAAAPPLFAPVVFTAPCVVPKLRGMGAVAAKRLITASHCAVGKVTTTKKPRSKRHLKLVVASSGLDAGTTSAAGTAVDIWLRWK